jgi:NAD(P)-dependent dehydrogenase (short-subunit alcohol dehydrogenase family)
MKATSVRRATQIRREGGRAVYVLADVTNPDDRQARSATPPIAEFGRIDTWVNNAAVSMYGKAFEIPIEDMRRQMDVIFWGHVYGSREPSRGLRQRGGALVNVASGLADRAIPLQGMYLRGQACREGLHRHAAHGARIGWRLRSACRWSNRRAWTHRSSTKPKPSWRRAAADSPCTPRDCGGRDLRCAEKPIREMIAGGAAE